MFEIVHVEHGKEEQTGKTGEGTSYKKYVLGQNRVRKNTEDVRWKSQNLLDWFVLNYLFISDSFLEKLAICTRVTKICTDFVQLFLYDRYSTSVVAK